MICGLMRVGGGLDHEWVRDVMFALNHAHTTSRGLAHIAVRSQVRGYNQIWLRWTCFGVCVQLIRRIFAHISKKSRIFAHITLIFAIYHA